MEEAAIAVQKTKTTTKNHLFYLLEFSWSLPEVTREPLLHKGI